MRGCNAVYAPEVSDHCPPRVWPLEAAIPEQAADASSALGENHLPDILRQDPIISGSAIHRSGD